MTYIWRRVEPAEREETDAFMQMALGDETYLEVRQGVPTVNGPKRWQALLIKRTPNESFGLWGAMEIFAKDETEACDTALKMAAGQLDRQFQQSLRLRQTVINAYLNTVLLPDCDTPRLFENVTAQLYVNTENTEPIPVADVMDGLAALKTDEGTVSRENPACSVIPEKYLTGAKWAGGTTSLNRDNPEAEPYLNSLTEKLAYANSLYKPLEVPKPPHTCVGFYPNGSYIVNAVRDEDLSNNIKYNAESRPGRIYFVDGKYACGGNVFEKDKLREYIEKFEKRLSEMNLPRPLHDSRPYK